MAIARRKLVAITVLGMLTVAIAPARAVAPERIPWLALADGRVGKFNWAVEVKRLDGPAAAGHPGARRPCLLVGTTWQLNRLELRRTRSRQCADAPGLSPSAPPLVATGVQPSDGAAPKITAVGLVFPPAARRVRVTLANGRTQVVNLHAPTAKQAQAAGLALFRYAAFVSRGEWCTERLVSESARGVVLWDSGTDAFQCGTTGPPRFASN